MISEEKQIILRVVERFIHTGSLVDEHVKVTCLPENKTSFVEQAGDYGRTILLDEYHLDDKVIWASYSPRSGTVYLSLKSAH